MTNESRFFINFFPYDNQQSEHCYIKNKLAPVMLKSNLTVKTKCAVKHSHSLYNLNNQISSHVIRSYEQAMLELAN